MTEDFVCGSCDWTGTAADAVAHSREHPGHLCFREEPLPAPVEHPQSFDPDA